MCGSGHTGPGQIWPDLFRVNNLMAQSDPNSGLIRLAHRAGPILPLLPKTRIKLLVSISLSLIFIVPFFVNLIILNTML